MRFASLSATILSALTLALPASATTTDFSVSGLDASQHGYDYTFSLDAPSYAYSGLALYQGVTISGNGGAATADIDLYMPYGATGIVISDPFFQILYVNPNGNTYLYSTDSSNGNAPLITPGTYTGFNYSDCPIISSLQPPRAFSALAMLDITPPAISCGAAINLNVTTTETAVSAEPASLVLLGSGALGIFGVVRRRFLS